jgi:hypothetical protein
VYNADLGVSLTSLSNHMLELGHHEDALDAILEAVKLYRQLAKQRPIVYNAELAHWVIVLSDRMSGMSHQGATLDLTRKALELANDCPAVHDADPVTTALITCQMRRSS